MNYYNPYFYTLPTSVAAPKVGLLGRLFGNSGITLGSILNGTQRALNFANQAIPLVKQVKPVIGNAKTMFKVMNEFKRVETPKVANNNSNNNVQSNTVNENTSININSNNTVESNTNEVNNETVNTDNGPTFFI